MKRHKKFEGGQKYIGNSELLPLAEARDFLLFFVKNFIFKDISKNIK